MEPIEYFYISFIAALLLFNLVVIPLSRHYKAKKYKEALVQHHEQLISNNKELVTRISSVIDFKLDEMREVGAPDYEKAYENSRDLIQSMNKTIEQFAGEDDIQFSIFTLTMLEKELNTTLVKLANEIQDIKRSNIN